MHKNCGRASMLVALSCLVLTACGSAAGGGGSGEGETVTLTFASPVPENHYSGVLDSAWMDAVTEASDGEIQFEVTWGGGLCAPADINGCVSNGIADLGLTVSSYHPADSPVSSISGVGFTTKDGAAQAQALQSLYQEFPDYQEEFSGQNQVLLYFAPLEVPTFSSAAAGLTEVADLQGLRLRVNGAYVAAVEALGAAPVTISLNEIYESLERGIVDGAQLSGSAIIQDYQLDEVAKYVYDIGQFVGPTTTSQIVMNADIWESLSTEHQEVLQSVSEEMVAVWGPEHLTPTYERACQDFEEAGVTTVLLQPSADHEEWVSSVHESQRAAWAAQSGLPDPGAFFTRYEELLAEHTTPETDKSGLEHCS